MAIYKEKSVWLHTLAYMDKGLCYKIQEIDPKLMYH